MNRARLTLSKPRRDVAANSLGVFVQKIVVDYMVKYAILPCNQPRAGLKTTQQ
jgi:hypothetical protein